MLQNEQTQLIRRKEDNADNFTNTDRTTTAHIKITMSQDNDQHEIEMETLSFNGTELNPGLVKEDDNATQQLPDEYKGHWYCGTSTGDGNCLYHACSLVICGDESLSAKLRQETADELLKNPGDYCTNHPYIQRIVQEKNLQNDEMLAMYHVMLDDYVKVIKSNKLLEHIREEGNKTQNDGQWSSLLHVLALSTVLQTPIQSIFPESEWNFRELYNGTIQPLPRKPNEIYGITSKSITIFWSGGSHVPYLTGCSRVPNHIVPVFSKTISETPISSNLSVVSNELLQESTEIPNSIQKQSQIMSSETSASTSASSRKQSLRPDCAPTDTTAPIEQGCL